MSNWPESYINSVIAEHFGEDLVKDPKVPIEKAGWYWSDRDDNASYTKWTGPYNSKQSALVAAKNFRRNQVREWNKNDNNGNSNNT